MTGGESCVGLARVAPALEEAGATGGSWSVRVCESVTAAVAALVAAEGGKCEE